MLRRFLPLKWRSNVQLLRILESSLLFVMLLLAIWLATQQREAQQLILLLLLYIITVNFSLPPAQGTISLVPIVAVTSLLIMALTTAVTLAAAGLILAELARPLWSPIWQNLDVPRPDWRQRLGTAVTYLLAISAGGVVYQQAGGQIPPVATNITDLTSFAALALVYGIIYTVLTLGFWLLWKQPFTTFINRHLLTVLTVSLFVLPAALFGSIVFALGGLPTFVIFCLSVMFISVLLWLSWQRSYIVQQRLAQFATLNSVGASLRETLDLPQVLARTYHTMAGLIAADQYTIALIDENGQWQRPLLDQSDTIPDVTENYIPDDFMCWVAQKARVLELDTQNLHFADRHDLTPPEPKPDAWLGVPLQTVSQPIGVLVLQRYAPTQAFSRWNREVLLAVAGQASAAIQNARLYSETVRLYNLTDEALAQRLKQLQALLNTMQEGVLMIGTDGQIILINTFAANLLNHPAAKLQNQQLDIATAAAPLGYQTDQLANLVMLLNEGHAPVEERLIYQTMLPDHPSGKSRRFMERTAAPVFAQAATIIGWLMLFRDVTEEHELTEQRIDLTRMIVHDLRNPVTTFISNMNLAQSLLSDDGKQMIVKEAISDAKRSSYDMLDMVDSLMDINRLEAGQLFVEVDALNLGRLLTTVTDRLQLLATQRQITLTTQIAPDTLPVWADEDMIRRVLINLIDNAIKFTPQGGQVDCLIQSEPALSTHYEPGARCIIRDNGPGIPAEHKDKIFNRFMRTNRGGAQIRGTGLGLAFCKLAIEAHEGHIWVEDGLDQGSQFNFTLPGIPILDN